MFPVRQTWVGAFAGLLICSVAMLFIFAEPRFPCLSNGDKILPTVHYEDSKNCMRHYKNVVLVELAKVVLVALK